MSSWARSKAEAFFRRRATRLGRGRIVVGAAMVLAVVSAALGAVPDSADAQSAGAGYFSDDDGSVHEQALNALGARGVLAGIECGEGLICPGEPLKRWEMAVWLVRVLDGADPGALSTRSFSDVDYDAWWAPFVERLFELGITVGCQRDPLQYCPDRSVTRAQMATFLKRAFELAAAPVAGFADVSGGSHADNIDALAAAGVTVGCNRDPLQYCPDRSVTRAQMASFLARALGIIELPASVRFTAIDAGYAHTCGLRADGSVVCWGDNQHGQAHALDGRFRAVSAGGNHSCGLRSDNTILCWGDNQYGQTGAPTGQFQAVSAGGDHTCGLRTDGTIDCWGYNGFGQANPPEGRFTAVTAGPAATAVSGHSCGLRAAGAIVCWGYNRHGQIDAPDGEFVSVAAGEFPFLRSSAGRQSRLLGRRPGRCRMGDTSGRVHHCRPRRAARLRSARRQLDCLLGRELRRQDEWEAHSGRGVQLRCRRPFPLLRPSFERDNRLLGLHRL